MDTCTHVVKTKSGDGLTRVQPWRDCGVLSAFRRQETGHGATQTLDNGQKTHREDRMLGEQEQVLVRG